MNYLMDTHTFMWWDANSSNLPTAVYDIIADSDNQIYLSTVSTWEITIKMQIGKLLLQGNLLDIGDKQIEENDIIIPPIQLPHTLKVGELPLHHKDPFDRLLIAQALVEDMTFLSKDSNFAKYEAKLLW